MSPARRKFLAFIVAVVLVHVVAIGLYYALGIPDASTGTQRVFGWSWLAATVAVVFVGLQRLKRARRQRN
jgi:hypothetical protein